MIRWNSNFQIRFLKDWITYSEILKSLKQSKISSSNLIWWLSKKLLTAKKNPCFQQNAKFEFQRITRHSPQSRTIWSGRVPFERQLSAEAIPYYQSICHIYPFPYVLSEGVGKFVWTRPGFSSPIFQSLLTFSWLFAPRATDDFPDPLSTWVVVSSVARIKVNSEPFWVPVSFKRKFSKEAFLIAGNFQKKHF